MKLSKTLIIGLGLFLCSCAMPSSPPPPPALPAVKEALPSLTKTELKVLYEMNQWSFWMVTLGDLVKTHSNRSVIINYGAKISADYRKQDESIQSFIKKRSLKLTKLLSDSQNKQLMFLKKLYGKRFDRVFLKEIVKELPPSLRIVQKTDQQITFSKDFVPLLKGFTDITDIDRNQARDMVHSQ